MQQKKTYHRISMVGASLGLTIILLGAGCSQEAECSQEKETSGNSTDEQKNTTPPLTEIKVDTSSTAQDLTVDNISLDGAGGLAGDGSVKIEVSPVEPSKSVDTTNNSAESKEKVFTVTGKNFAYNMSEIRVKKGDRVTINFTSESGFHDWVADAFNARTERVQTGGTTSVTFIADKTGTFEYYCSVGSHRAMGMKGNLIVE